MTSKPLLTNVAQSTVIFLPIAHLGWLSASLALKFFISSRVLFKNGPPEAVKIILFTSLLLSLSITLLSLLFICLCGEYNLLTLLIIIQTGFDCNYILSFPLKARNFCIFYQKQDQFFISFLYFISSYYMLCSLINS